MSGTEQAGIEGDIGIEDDKIVYVGDVPGGFRPDKVLMPRNTIVMPGLIKQSYSFGHVSIQACCR